MEQTASRQPSFHTKARHRKLGALLGLRKKPPPGHRAGPVLVRLDPEPGAAPSDKPPVRIFVGSEPAQYRAERVLIWSILRVRDKARAYEIYLMKDLEGYDRSRWGTGFTHYRHAIPHLAGGAGRAIYNDVDQIYCADPGELFDMDMGGAGILGIDEKETSVMLLDCEKMAEVWKLEDAKTYHKHKYHRRRAHQAGLWGFMPPEWNARDHEFVAGRSKLFHFTTLYTQPWRPFPDEFKYQAHDRAEAWFELERAADAAGFTVFTKDRPSDRFLELLEMYRQMHEGESPPSAKSRKKPFTGLSLVWHIKPIADLVRQTGARTILDYGSGKARHYRDSPEHEPGSRYKVMDAWRGAVVTCYDPGYEPFAGDYEDAYDGVIATDVLEHIPEEDISWVLEELFSHSGKFLYVVATCFPAKKVLPDGGNAHCTVMPPDWWRGQMEIAARRHPDIAWVLCVKERSIFSFRKRKRLTRKGLKIRHFSGEGLLTAHP